jgi:hypothetical protein
MDADPANLVSQSGLVGFDRLTLHRAYDFKNLWEIFPESTLSCHVDAASATSIAVNAFRADLLLNQTPVKVNVDHGSS